MKKNIPLSIYLISIFFSFFILFLMFASALISNGVDFGLFSTPTRCHYLYPNYENWDMYLWFFSLLCYFIWLLVFNFYIFKYKNNKKFENKIRIMFAVHLSLTILIFPITEFLIDYIINLICA